MSLTYAQIVGRLEAIEDDLAQRTEDYESAANDYHRLIRDWELRLAQTMMTVEGNTATEKKAAALTAIAASGNPLYAELKDAEGRYHGLKAAVRTLETRATIGQSLLKATTRESGPSPQWSAAA